ncbi:glycosyltransferase [Metabacillus litoralis]|uniref:glycosyltransferase n=1 Tax=Metabacillus litoralis TaxID=152268 RepID=UPI002040E3F1|nr:glycosyltransferase [Metabacillus litoralis]MCM3409930.1 glycosyltransferase [Metabacillus litoralis]
MKKVIAFVDHTAKLSGGEIALFNLIKQLDKNKYMPIVILSEEGELAEKLISIGIKVKILALKDSIKNRNRHKVSKNIISSIIHLIIYSYNLSKLLKRENVDIVHTNSLKAAIFGGISAKLSNKKLIWHIRDSISYPYLSKKTAGIIKILSRYFPNAIVANSHYTLDTLNLPANKLKNSLVIYSGYSGEFFLDEKEKENFNVVMVGRLAEWKGQHILIEAASKLKEYKDINFYIVGGPLFGEKQYEKLIHDQKISLELDNVNFVGHVSNVNSYLKRADVLVHASISPEPFGQVIVEGMAHCLPVIATNIGGPKEIVIDDETGYLIPANNPTLLAERIIKLKEDRVLRKEMGLAGVARVKNKFTIEVCANKVSEFYDRF